MPNKHNPPELGGEKIQLPPTLCERLVQSLFIGAVTPLRQYLEVTNLKVSGYSPSFTANERVSLLISSVMSSPTTRNILPGVFKNQRPAHSCFEQ